MKKLLTLIAALALVASVGTAHADSPDFGSLLANARTSDASQMSIGDVEVSNLGLVASIQRKADLASLPFHRLTDQFINRAVKTKSANALERSAASPDRPFIYVAGYWDTVVTESAGGQITLLAYVVDAQGTGDISTVEIFAGGVGTGVFMSDDASQGDFAANDGVYGWQLPNIQPGDIPAGQYLLEIRATDSQGNVSDLWPYLTIH